MHIFSAVEFQQVKILDWFFTCNESVYLSIEVIICNISAEVDKNVTQYNLKKNNII